MAILPASQASGSETAIHTPPQDLATESLPRRAPSPGSFVRGPRAEMGVRGEGRSRETA